MAAPRRLVVGISGASGTVYGIRLLEVLRGLGVETHLVMSHAAEVTAASETTLKIAAIKALAHVSYANSDIGAPVASGSFHMDGMIVAPCSIKTLSEIAHGITANLMSRAADVALKERRRVVLMVRETPLHAGHLRTMSLVTEMGAIVAPPMPAFYALPRTLEDVVDHSIGRVLDLFGLDAGMVRRWGTAADGAKPRRGAARARRPRP